MTDDVDVNQLNHSLVQRVLLDEVRVVGMSCESLRPTPDEGPIYLNSRVTGGFHHWDEGCVTHVTVTVDAQTASASDVAHAPDVEPDEDSGSDDGESIWSAVVTIACDWSIQEDAPPGTEDEWNALSRIQGVLAAYPYARQQIQYLSTSMGYPPATLDLMRPHANTFAQSLKLKRDQTE